MAQISTPFRRLVASLCMAFGATGVQASIGSPPVTMPTWWGQDLAQTASFYADFSQEGLGWDEAVVGAGLQLPDFFIDVQNMHWVDDPLLGKGYQANNADGAIVFTYDNLMVRTNRKTLVDVLEISVDDIDRVKDPLVEAQWGSTGWDTGGAVGGIQTQWEWTHKEGKIWLLKITSVLTPQPDKVRITVPILGGSGPVIHRGWTGEQCAPVPEPESYALAAVGLLTVGWLRRRCWRLAPAC